MKKIFHFCLLDVLQFPACSLWSFILLHRARGAWNAKVSGICARFMSINQWLTALLVLVNTLQILTFFETIPEGYANTSPAVIFYAA